MKKQKAIIVNDFVAPNELNTHLEQGWRVVMATPFSGNGFSCDHMANSCLVILEKDE